MCLDGAFSIIFHTQAKYMRIEEIFSYIYFSMFNPDLSNLRARFTAVHFRFLDFSFEHFVVGWVANPGAPRCRILPPHQGRRPRSVLRARGRGRSWRSLQAGAWGVPSLDSQHMKNHIRTCKPLRITGNSVNCFGHCWLPVGFWESMCQMRFKVTWYEFNK